MTFSNFRNVLADSVVGLKTVKNYVGELNDFESGANKLIGYSDGTTRPTGTFGGSASALTKSIVSTNPLKNTYSLKLTKTGACQGQGYYYDITPTRADKLSCAMMRIKFKVELITGTFVGSSDPLTDSDLIVGVWDVANNKVIEPSTRLFQGMVTGFVYDYNAEFQVPINATTLKFYIHHANSGASTFEIVIDDFEISPNQYNYGPSISNMKPYTCVLKGNANGVTYTNQTTTAFYMRVGPLCYVDINTNFTGTPTGGTGNFNWTLPPDVTADLSKTSASDLNKLIGGLTYTDSGTAFRCDAVAYLQNTTAIAGNHDGAAASAINLTTPVTWTTNDSIKITGWFAVQGWEANNQQSDSYIGRTLASSAYLSTTTTFNSTTILYDTKTLDKSNAYNPATGEFTCQTDGLYLGVVQGFSTSTAIGIGLQKNGSTLVRSYQTSATNDDYAHIVKLVECKAGDKLRVVTDGNYSVHGSSIDNHFDVYKIGDSTSISAIESIFATYRSTAGQSFTATESVANFGTLVEDSHGCVSNAGSDWTFTAKANGLYETHVLMTASTFQSNADFWGVIHYNGVEVCRHYDYTQSSGHLANVRPYACQRLLAGQTIKIRARAGNPVSVSTNPNENFVCVKRVGL